MIHKKCVAIIQARLNSSRLPLKGLLCLKENPIIDWVITRISKSTKLDQIIVALPDTKIDNILANHLEQKGINYIQGPEDDVLSRFILASKKTNADLIIRICADNPLIWHVAIDRLIDFYQNNKCDYSYNHIPKNNLWPDGLGAEIISRDLLEEIHLKAKEQNEREHCLNYIWHNNSKYCIKTFDPIEKWLCRPDLKLDIDTKEDFVFLSEKAININMDAKEIIAAFDFNNNIDY